MTQGSWGVIPYYIFILSFAFRVDPEDVDGIPKIPAQPIGYDDAKKLLEKMGGIDSPTTWKGRIEGIEYKVRNCITVSFGNLSCLTLFFTLFVIFLIDWRGNAANLRWMDC